jgi:hypothetical protein
MLKWFFIQNISKYDIHHDTSQLGGGGGDTSNILTPLSFECAGFSSIGMHAVYSSKYQFSLFNSKVYLKLLNVTIQRSTTTVLIYGSHPLLGMTLYVVKIFVS